MLRLLYCALIVAGALCASACSRSGESAPPEFPPPAELPVYNASQAPLFGDSIAPSIFSIPNDGRPAVENPKLIPRVEQADVVIRARITTVTEDRLDNQSSYRLILSTIGPPLAGTPRSETIELRLDGDHPSAPYVKNRETELAGQTVLLFLRWYNEGGETVAHFHMDQDDPKLVEAVKRAKVLDEFDG